MSPIIKNALLAFVAAAVTSVSVAIEALPDNQVNKGVLVAICLSALYAGVRAGVGALKVALTDKPFAVDTEAPVAE